MIRDKAISISSRDQIASQQKQQHTNLLKDPKSLLKTTDSSNYNKKDKNNASKGKVNNKKSLIADRNITVPLKSNNKTHKKSNYIRR